MASPGKDNERMKSYKNKALNPQEMRRRREEEGIQLRKQKREEQVNTVLLWMKWFSLFTADQKYSIFWNLTLITNIPPSYRLINEVLSVTHYTFMSYVSMYLASQSPQSPYHPKCQSPTFFPKQVYIQNGNKLRAISIKGMFTFLHLPLA